MEGQLLSAAPLHWPDLVATEPLEDRVAPTGPSMLLASQYLQPLSLLPRCPWLCPPLGGLGGGNSVFR